MRSYYVYYGEEKYPFEIPSGWRVVQNTLFEEAETFLTVPEMVKRGPGCSHILSQVVGNRP